MDIRRLPAATISCGVCCAALMAGDVAPPGLTLALRRPLPLPTTQHSAPYQALYLTPRLALTVLHSLPPAPAVAGPPPPAAAPSRAATPWPLLHLRLLPLRKVLQETERRRQRIDERQRWHVLHTAARVTEHHQEQVIQRLVQRITRVESGRQQAPSPAPVNGKLPAPAPAFTPAVPRILRRPGPVMIDSADNGRPAPVPAPVSRPESQRPPDLAGGSVTGVTAVDINRLTDQVVQTIDRRIIAHRERLGRI